MLLVWQYVKEPGFHMACIHLYLHVEALIFDKEYPVIMILQKKLNTSFAGYRKPKFNFRDFSEFQLFAKKNNQ